jgi:hypothetical protein
VQGGGVLPNASAVQANLGGRPDRAEVGARRDANAQMMWLEGRMSQVRQALARTEDRLSQVALQSTGPGMVGLATGELGQQPQQALPNNAVEAGEMGQVALAEQGAPAAAIVNANQVGGEGVEGIRGAGQEVQASAAGARVPAEALQDDAALLAEGSRGGRVGGLDEPVGGPPAEQNIPQERFTYRRAALRECRGLPVPTADGNIQQLGANTYALDLFET